MHTRENTNSFPLKNVLNLINANTTCLPFLYAKYIDFNSMNAQVELNSL